MLTGPGFGRILPMPFLPPSAFETAGLVALSSPSSACCATGVYTDRPHAAWLWSIAVLRAVTLLSRVIAFSPAGEAIDSLATPSGPITGTDGLAFPPPPGPRPGPRKAKACPARSAHALRVVDHHVRARDEFRCIGAQEQQRFVQ